MWYSGLLELQGTWGESLPQLVQSSWSPTRAGLTNPVLSPAAEQYLLDRVAPFEASSAATDPSRASLQAAVRCSGGVLRALAFLQIRMLLRHGKVPVEPPLSSGMCTVGPGINEGNDLSMEGREFVPCRVSFQKGVEQTCYFFVRGAREVPDPGPDGRVPSQLCSPQIVLAVPAPEDPTVARVLSAAPLMGARPEVDRRHPRWLHVHVRPPLSDLVRTVSGVPPTSVLGMLRRTSMRDGHWVLAFSDGDKSQAACELCDRAVEQERRLVRGILDQLLEESLRPDWLLSASSVSAAPAMASAVATDPLPSVVDPDAIIDS